MPPENRATGGSNLAPPDGRLESWKEIAAYLQRDVRTVQRWEKTEGLPVHRHQHAKRSSPYAYTQELDAWWESRRVRPANGDRRRRSSEARLALGAILAVLLAAVLLATASWWVFRHVDGFTNADASLAVIAFQDLGEDTDPILTEGATSLLNAGLLEANPCRILSPEYLYDLHRRRFGPGPIRAEESLEVARDSGATLLLTGDVDRLGTGVALSWRLVDTRSGEGLGGQRLRGKNLSSLVDQVIRGVLPLLASGSQSQDVEPPRPVAEVTTASPEAYEHYIAARLATAAEKIEDARRHYETAIALDSTFALAYFELGLTHSYTWEQELQRRFVDRAWELREDLGVKDRMRLEGVRESLHGRLPASLQVYREMLERWPDDRQTLQAVAQAYRSRWFSTEAVRIAERGLKLYPDDPSLEAIQRSCLRATGRLNEALSEYREYARLHADDPDAWNDLARTDLVMGHVDSAEALFDRALRLDPMHLDARKGLALCAHARGNLDLAIRAMEKMLERSSLSSAERIDILALDLVGMYIDAGQFEDALDAARRARALVPNAGTQTSRRFENLKTTILTFSGRAEESLESFRRFTSRADLDPADEWEMEIQRAFALIVLDSIPEARVSVAKLFEDEPFEFGAYHIRAHQCAAWLEIVDGHADRALALLQESEQYGIPPLTFMYVHQHRFAGRAYRLANQLDQAASEYREALRGFGGLVCFGYTLARYELAQVEEERGNHREAEAQYQTCLRLWSRADPGMPELEDARQRCERLRKIRGGV